MSPSAAPDPRTASIDQLGALLGTITVQELRLAAQVWGWPVKGTAKASIIEQLVERLTDPITMAAAFRILPTIQQQVLIWQAHLARTDDQGEALRAAISKAEGRELSKQAVTRAITELRQRLLLVVDAYRGTVVPDIYGEWLPCSEATGMVYRGVAATTIPAFSVEELDQYVEHLLVALASDRPRTENAAPALQGMGGRSTGGLPRGPREVIPHAGIVSDALLSRWGYREPEEQDLPRTLLSVMLAGGLCVVKDAGADTGLLPDAEMLTNWHELSPEARRSNLTYWWMRGWQGAMPPASQVRFEWDELDTVLRSTTGFTLRQSIDWMGREQLDAQIKIMRAWLLSLVQVFKKDVWYSTAALLELIYEIRRDLLFTTYYSGWSWYDGDTRLEARQMPPGIWSDSYGSLVAAWLIGPARWLGLIQVAVDGGRVVAFMRPSAVETTRSIHLPPDTLRFLPNGQLILRNSWQVTDLRQIIRKLARETTRDRERTTYTLDATAFRETLRNGETAAQVVQALAGAGFPVPDEVQRKLQDWQARMGRHQLYDNLAVIEFSDDVMLAEVQATTGLGRAELYPISPRCVVVLRPDIVPALLEELRRKGYSPQVIS